MSSVTEQASWAMAHCEPLGLPGERFHYSDTGYVLLGQLIETITGLPQAKAYETLLSYDQLGFTSTWFETLEPPPPQASPRAHQYHHPSDTDSYHFDPSFDLYGGGGLVSTVADLNRFYIALFGARVIGRASLRTMLTTAAAGEPDEAMGIVRIASDGTACWYHSGFWGSVSLYCPRRHIAVAVTVNTAGLEAPTPSALDTALVLAHLRQ
jgi:D-alanyl-D-alanine carboxypeptidase